MSSRTPGPALTVLTPCTLAVTIGVAIAAVWGLDWRWIPTTILVGIVVLFVASTVDSWKRM